MVEASRSRIVTIASLWQSNMAVEQIHVLFVHMFDRYLPTQKSDFQLFIIKLCICIQHIYIHTHNIYIYTQIIYIYIHIIYIHNIYIHIIYIYIIYIYICTCI